MGEIKGEIDAGDGIKFTWRMVHSDGTPVLADEFDVPVRLRNIELTTVRRLCEEEDTDGSKVNGKR